MILDSYKHQRNAYCKTMPTSKIIIWLSNLFKRVENQIAPILEMPSHGYSECSESIDEIDKTVIFNK